MSGCSAVGSESDKAPTGNLAQICESWELIYPSRSQDKISRKTAESIARVNTANESWCGTKPIPPKTPEAKTS